MNKIYSCVNGDSSLKVCEIAGTTRISSEELNNILYQYWSMELLFTKWILRLQQTENEIISISNDTISAI